MPNCVICNVPINEMHYGISSCRACAAFFRRTISLNLEYTCRFEQSCELTSGKRHSCRYCRYQRCVAMGMKKEEDAIMASMDPKTQASTSGGQSMFPMDKVYNHESIESILDRISSQSMHSSIQDILKRRLDRIFDHMEPHRCQEYSVPLTLCQQGMISYQDHKRRWPQCTKEKVDQMAATSLNLDDYLRDFYAELEYIAIFCMEIDVFAKLAKDQKWLLYKHLSPRFHHLERTYMSGLLLGHDKDHELNLTYDGQIFDLATKFDNIESVSNVSYGNILEYLNSTIEKSKKMFTDPLLKMQATEFEMVYMFLTCLFGVSRANSKFTEETIAVVESSKTRLAEELHQYYTYELKQANYADRVHKMSNIMAALDKVEECRKEDIEMSKTFNLFREDIYLSELLYDSGK